jgi:hypothetical protein
MQQHQPGKRYQKEQQAARDLEALGREGDLLHGLWHRSFGRAIGHFSAEETEASDPIELWGRRIGRSLGAIGFVAFGVYLYVTYVH